MLLRIALPWDGLKEEFVPITAESLEISGVVRFLVNLAAISSPSCVLVTKKEHKYSGMGTVQKEPLEVLQSLVSGPYQRIASSCKKGVYRFPS